MLIDVHGHIGRVLPDRSEFVDVTNLIAKMDAWGIDVTCVLPLSEHREGRTWSATPGTSSPPARGTRIG